MVIYLQFEEDEQKSRLPGYSLDDQVVIEAKEKGRELFAHLSLSERKQTLDDKVYYHTVLQIRGGIRDNFDNLGIIFLIPP